MDPDHATSRRRAEARLQALIGVSRDVVYVMSADGGAMQVLDGHGLIPAMEAPSRDWMQRLVPAREHARHAVQAGDARRLASLHEQTAGYDLVRLAELEQAGQCAGGRTRADDCGRGHRGDA